MSDGNRHERKSNFEKFLTGKGYYAVIAVALLAVGASAFAATRDGLEERSRLQEEQTPLVEFQPEKETSLPQEGVEADEQEKEKTSAQENSSSEKQKSTEEQTTTEPEEKKDEGGEPTAGEAVESSSVVTTPPTLSAPVPGKVMNPHSRGASVYSETMQDYRQHDGVDLVAAVGDEVVAAADGTIDGLYFDDLWGEVIVITHTGGMKTIYKNLSSTLPDGIRPGARVTKGQTIGTIGDEGMIESSSDPHLHFEVEKNGENIDPAELISF